MSVLFSDPGSSQRAQQSALALYEAGMLAGYVTTLAYRPERWSGRLLRSALRLAAPDPERLLARRRIGAVPDHYLRTYPLWELARLAAQRLGAGPIIEDALWERGSHAFARQAARAVGGARAVVASEYAALEAFEAARGAGLRTIYYQASPHHRAMSAVLDREHAAFPEARSAYDDHVRPLAGRRNAHRDAELGLADLVIVSSSYARQSLLAAGVPPERIAVCLLGAPPVSGPDRVAPGGPAIFLSAGNQAVHKGTHYLLQAWEALRPGPAAELWLVGRMHLPERLLRGLPDNVRVRPTVSYQELSRIYARASALVFPSLCDGFGAVIVEAMAHGLPVITTPHTAGPDIITPGEEGLIVPAGDAGALAAAMQRCLDHADELEEMGRRAARRAAGMQWETYRRAFAAAVGRAIDGGGPCGASAW